VEGDVFVEDIALTSRPGGPAMVKGAVLFDTSCASSIKNGSPPKWSP
jgi:hypothetical protein